MDAVDSAEARYGWGQALSQVEQYEQAIPQYQRAVARKPIYPEAYSGWAWALSGVGQADDAVTQLQTAAEQDPTDRARYYYEIGNFFLEARSYDSATEWYEKARETAKEQGMWSAYARHNEAYVLERLGYYHSARAVWGEARDAYRRLEEEDGNVSTNNYHYYWGSIEHEDIGDLDEAERIYKRRLEAFPDDTDILKGFVDVCLEKNRRPTTISPEQRHLRAGILAGLKDLRQRFPNAAGGVSKETNPSSDPDRIQAYWRALRHYRRALAILSGKKADADGYLKIGSLHLAIGEYDLAVPELLLGLKQVDNRTLQDPRKTDTLQALNAALGVAYARKEYYQQAVRHFEAALRLDPDDLTVRSRMAEAYLRLGVAEKKTGLVLRAEEEYRKILAITPHHVESRVGLGEVYTAMAEDGEADMYRQAVDCFLEGVKEWKPDHGSKRSRRGDLAPVYYSLGYAQVKLYETSGLKRDEGWLREALINFRKCKEDDPSFSKARRAIEKLEQRSSTTVQSLTETLGPLLVSVVSGLVFVIVQIGLLRGWSISSSIGYYVLLTFGSLLFMIAGLYLPQVLKLKVGVIELEKSPVTQVTSAGTIGIRR